MIKDKLFDAYLLGSLLLGCALAAPYIVCMIVRSEFRARM